MRRTNLGSAYIPKQQLANKITRIGYRFVGSSDRVDVYRLPNGAHYVSLPRTKRVSVEAARSILRQCGLDEDEIGEFLRLARA